MAKGDEQEKTTAASAPSSPTNAPGGKSGAGQDATGAVSGAARPTNGGEVEGSAQSGRNTGTAGARASGTAQGAAKVPSGEDAIALLKADHRKVEALFSEFASAADGRKAEIINEACQELVIHTLLEERIFYPAARQASTEDKLDEAQVEHDAAKVLIVELLEGDDSDEYRDAKFKVLAEQIKHHVKEEEASDGVFAKAQKAGVNTSDLAARLTELKQQLQQRAESGGLPDPVPASFTYFGEPMQERNMPRERDDQGRFTSDDDDRSQRGRGSNGRDRDSQGRYASDDDRGYRSRGRDDDRYGDSNDRDRDSRGRFTSDDDDRSYRSRGRDDDDDRGGRGSSSRGGGRGEGGWFGDSRGHAEASRRGWEERDGGSRGRSSRDDDDDRYRSRGRDDDDRGGRSGGDRGQGGWFGDSRGHAEASRRGWENSDHGDSGWYGDSRGHSEASRRGWENPDHGESGWFGDSRGHSEAARRGWEDRGGRGGSNFGRGEERSFARRDYDDDDDRGGRGSGDGRGGHGGWSGDPEGHAEAARRGWQNRR